MRLDDRTLLELARGCGLLGAGGGGDTSVPLTMARLAVAEHGPVAVVGPDELPGDGVVMPCGLIGWPLVATERLPSGDEGRMLRDAVEARRGAPVVALMPYSVGGANGLLCVTWAARLGLPLLDADVMGRTFPSLTQTSTGLAGIPATPAILTDGRANTVLLEAADDAWAEHLVRGIAASMGGVCAVALACLSVAEARAATIAGSVSLARRRGADADGLGRVLIGGRVTELERRSSLADGAGVSLAIHQDDRRVRLEARGELVLALEDGMPCGGVPDVLALVDDASDAPVPVERLRDGQLVRLLLIDAPPIWRRPEARGRVGPASFGLAPAWAAQENGIADAGF